MQEHVLALHTRLVELEGEVASVRASVRELKEEGGRLRRQLAEAQAQAAAVGHVHGTPTTDEAPCGLFAMTPTLHDPTHNNRRPGALFVSGHCGN